MLDQTYLPAACLPVALSARPGGEAGEPVAAGPPVPHPARHNVIAAVPLIQ
ncbi:MAG: hypothetical protein ACYCO9_16560 [Streptosporangiaceae bacterium]